MAVIGHPLATSGQFQLATKATIADDLDKRTWRQLDLAVRLLEPLMLLILASFVLVIAVALLLPVMKMSTSI